MRHAFQAAFDAQGVPARIVARDDGGVDVTGATYALRLSLWSVAVSGTVDRETYFALGRADERMRGALVRAFRMSGYWRHARQIDYSLRAIRAGRGPIYERITNT